MGRLYIYLLLCLFIASCAKSTGFQASDYTYTRAEKLSEGQVKPEAPPKKGQVVRDSNRIFFTPTRTDWSDANVTLKAQVRIDDKALGEVEFTGVKTGSRVHLKPVDPGLNDKIQAQLICVSDEGTCTEFFIDVFYRENEVYFHDQILAKAKGEKIPSPAPKEPDSKSKGGNGNSSPSQPTQESKSPKKQVVPPLKVEPIIEDEISDLEIDEDAGFVGTPDEEVQELFNPKAAKKQEPVVPEEKEDSKDGNAPQKDSPNKANSPKGTDTSKKDSTVGEGNSKGPSKQPQDQQSGQGGAGALKVLERFRASDQAINSPSKGRLEKGTNLFQVAQAADFGFKVTKAVGTKDYYSTFGLAQTIAKIAEALKGILPNRTLYVTALSKWGGGHLSPHKSHQNGTDADVRYLRSDERAGSLVVDSKGRLSSNFLAAQQWELFKKAFSTNNIEMMFVGPAIKRAMCEEARRSGDYKTGDNDSPGANMLRKLVIERGHNDHFHIRVRCSDRRCSRIKYTIKSVGC